MSRAEAATQNGLGGGLPPERERRKCETLQRKVYRICELNTFLPALHGPSCPGLKPERTPTPGPVCLQALLLPPSVSPAALQLPVAPFFRPPSPATCPLSWSLVAPIQFLTPTPTKVSFLKPRSDHAVRLRITMYSPFS